jgi:hypothetical protein
MPLLPDKASAEEARQAAGLPTEGWKSFIVTFTALLVPLQQHR